LYEMLTANLPFQGEYDSAMMYSILNEEPEPIQSYRSGLSSELLHVVNRALEKKPDERYQSVKDMLIDLKRLKRDTDRVSRDSAAYRAAVGTGGPPPGPTSAHPSGPTPGPPRRRKRSYLIGGAVAAAAIIVALALIGRNLFRSVPADSAFGENSVAVMYFENSSGEEDLGKILADMLTSNLSRCEQLDVVSSQHLFDILKRMGMEDVEAIDRSVATGVAVNAGVRSMLLGSIYRVGGTLTANAQLCDVRTGKVLGAAQARGSRVEDVFEMVNTLTRDVITLMGVASEKGDEELRINDVTTNSYEAYKHYVKGWEHINRFAWKSAWAEFEEALRIDSTFAMAHTSSAFVTTIFKSNPTSDLGPEREAIRMAKKHSERATEKERYFIEVMDQFVHREYERAVETCREMAAAYPNSRATYGLMAVGYFNLGYWRKAIEAWDHVLALDPEDGNAYNMRAYCYAYLGEYDKAIQSVGNYIAVMPDVSNTYDSACEIYIMMERYDDAYRVCEDALRVNPDWTKFRQLQSYIHLFRGEHREALEMNRRLMETNPTKALELGHERGCFY
ncbi:MAG TPA: tetratricopeptide repeat protein, partial [Candidatus Eisenbacteria bacterium]|nr:tetratricopeptide repeat protein [Candidatus Eisenbacteria bacterium]